MLMVERERVKGGGDGKYTGGSIQVVGMVMGGGSMQVVGR